VGLLLEVLGPGRKDAEDESGWILGAPRPEEGWLSKSGVGFC
jgi:hypothetical protein